VRQWDAIPSEFGSRSTCYRRFVEWTQEGVFRMMHSEMLLRSNAEKRTPVLIVAVTLALDVAVVAPVMVAALGNWNDIVKVFDAVRRSRIDELREHRHDALEHVDAALVQLAFDQLIELHDIEGRSTFRGRASGHRVVLRLIGPRCTSASLGNVLWDRLRGAPDLLCQVAVALG
jgi:hypothetical protein